MTEDVTLVFHGFLNLPNLEKLKMIEMINEYFDSTNREPIRAANEESFKELNLNAGGKKCKCCGR